MEQTQWRVDRVEHKYFLSPATALQLFSRLEKGLLSDPNNHTGGYLVKSLYFDDPSDSGYYAKAGGTFFHRKLRLRIYDEDDTAVKLEQKLKFGERQTKRSIQISRFQAECLCRGEYDFLQELDAEDALSFYLLFAAGYRPSSILSYRRQAFWWPTNDLRITFDSEISGTDTDFRFFEPQLCLRPVFDPGTVVLEVKYSGCLPRFVRNLPGPLPGSRVSASKYALSRRRINNL